MLSKAIVEAYAWIVETVLWVMLAFGALVGYQFGVPLLGHFGIEPIYEGPWKFIGAIAGMAGTFLLLAVSVGPLLVLLRILKSVQSIEGRTKHDDARIHHSLEAREPFLR